MSKQCHEDIQACLRGFLLFNNQYRHTVNSIVVGQHVTSRKSNAGPCQTAVASLPPKKKRPLTQPHDGPPFKRIKIAAYQMGIRQHDRSKEGSIPVPVMNSNTSVGEGMT
ncbi:hypothetical protein MAR_034177 [Mya arenaria]|uniref:Uncharacterized protein n=1 Tax=Mya arenaria TaxID=6604 RepID=A0ABY7GC21_MYAAR|nr:hypothetical protein MAR_034177 [Mya arenaria]